MDRTSMIFGNPMDAKTIRKAEKSKAKYIRKFGDDSKTEYHLAMEPLPQIEELGIDRLVHSEEPLILPKNALVVGNIRMGFGHYRISLAIASCAKALGFWPVWLDLASFESTGSKMIRHQNDLYSLGSRLSQKFGLFNRLVWEPMNSEGFRKLTYNAVDQKNSELLVPLFTDIPKDVPYVATHVWPAQAAVHAGLTNVVNAIPDNWPMGLHLSEGAIHTVQTPFAYFGYKMLNGMAKTALKPMPDEDLFEVGHYIDHELVDGIEEDCEARFRRIEGEKPVRFLMTVGGAGAGADLYLAMTRHLLEYVKQKKASLIINLGDHAGIWDLFRQKIPGIEEQSTLCFNDFKKVRELAKDPDISGITVLCHEDIFEAVYSTNLLMRSCDVLVTKPSELAFYPVPKLIMRHIGGHEVYGAIHTREVGDATFECETKESLCGMIDSLIGDRRLLAFMNEHILKGKEEKLYNGGYEAVKLAVAGRH